MKFLRVCDREITSHGACTSGTSLVLTVASLQRLKMEALVPAPAGMIKRLNAQSIAQIEIHRQLCQVYEPNVLNKQMVHLWCIQFCGVCTEHDISKTVGQIMITLVS